MAEPTSGWLFTRGSESVHLVRKEDSKGCHLLLRGPGSGSVSHEFTDVTECMKQQAEIEQNLLVEGYKFTRDRREDGTWHGADRRRAAS
jgi:hypothetical protein